MNIPLHNFSSDDDSSIPFRMITLNTRSHYDSSVPHRHNYYEIFIFFKGGGTHDIDFNTFEIESNSIHFVSPGQVHQVRRELDTYGYVILFSRDFYSLNIENKDILFELPFLNNYSHEPIVTLKEEEIALFQPVFENLKRESADQHPHHEALLQSYLHILLLLSHRFYKKGTRADQIPGIVKQFRILLEKNFTSLHKVKDYAQLIGTSEKTLNDTIKKYTGSTASEHIYNRILLEAKRLIKHSPLSTKEIAYFLNYEDPAHFSKFFKVKTGITPGEFRTA
jgi:AraC family transcriptional regulator, transcriptional activator of pobA